ncbi:MAG: hypothetical protein ACRBBQ_10500 [Cognatishimia sp.]
MTHKTPPEGAAVLEDEIAMIRQTVAQMTRLLAMLEADVMAQDEAAIKGSTRLLADIRSWSKLAIETEVRFEERRKRQNGVARDYALDLERARETIGCRLARLRRCCGAGKLLK